MKRLTLGALALTLALSPLAAISKVECPELNSAQVRTLNKTWRYGEEKMGAGWGVKLSALAYQETKLGKDTKGRGSYGVFQLRPSTVADMNDIKMTGHNLKGIKVRLTNEFQYSAIQAHKYLEFWKDKGYPDSKVYSSYNGGYKRNAAARQYSRSVQKHVVTFNQCYTYRHGEVHERHKTAS